MRMMRIVVADDHRLLTRGLKIMLEAVPEFQVVGEAYDGLEAVRLAERLRPEVLITDLRMPGLDGIQVTQAVCRSCPTTRVIVLSLYANKVYVTRAFEAGALGYVSKDASGDELVEAVRAVAAGEKFLGSQLEK